MNNYNINYTYLKGGSKKIQGKNCYFITNDKIIENLSNFTFYTGNDGNDGNDITQDKEIKQSDLDSYKLLTKYICLKFPNEWINNTIAYNPAVPLAAIPFFSQYNMYDKFIIVDGLPQHIFCKKIGEIYYIIQTVPDKDDFYETQVKHLLWRPHGLYIKNEPNPFNITGKLTIKNIENGEMLFSSDYGCSAHDRVYSNKTPQINFKEVWDNQEKFHLYYVEYNNVTVNDLTSVNFKGYFKLIHEDSIESDPSIQLKKNFENFFNTDIL